MTTKVCHTLAGMPLTMMYNWGSGNEVAVFTCSKMFMHACYLNQRQKKNMMPLLPEVNYRQIGYHYRYKYANILTCNVNAHTQCDEGDCTMSYTHK